MHCHANLNLGNLPTGSCNIKKNNDAFDIVKKHETDFLGLADHGLNLRGLVPSQNWLNRSRGQLEKSRSHLAWNKQWQHTNPRTWGGRGFTVQGNANCRFLSSQDNPDGLGRWVSLLLRGAEGRVIRLVGAHCLCPMQGLETVHTPTQELLKFHQEPN